MASLSLGLPLLNTSVAEAVYKEITSRTSRYYYFLGKTLDWEIDDAPPLPSDSVSEQKEARNNIIILKEVLPTDVSFVVRRIDWTSNTIYDMYDDLYTDKLVGVNLLAGGSNYSNNPNIIITGGGGSGAVANVVVTDGVITSAFLEKKGTGYNAAPTITITDATGNNASAVGVINFPYSGATNLKNSNFYVMTDEFNIYKCLDNNNNTVSTVKPTNTGTEPFKTADGYVWKFILFVPPSLRNKFLTTSEIPVASALRTPFYSAGELRNIIITNKGENYTSASIVVQGDGYLELDPFYITSVTINASDNNYSYANVIIAPPYSNATPWSNNTLVGPGLRISHDNNIYVVTKGGTTSTSSNVQPVHTVGEAENGNAILSYIGTQATGTVTITDNVVAGVSLFGMLKDISITEAGSGYLTAPSVSFSGGSGSNAAAYAVLTNNAVTNIVITDLGKNYSSAPTITIGTTYTNNSNVIAGQQVAYLENLYTVTVTGNTLSTSPPTHTSGELEFGTANLAYAGDRATATVDLKYGAGYLGKPTVAFTGDGTNARGTVNVTKSEAKLVPVLADGQIDYVRIEDGGIGYTFASLTVVGNGSNAELLADFNPGFVDSLQSSVELLATPGEINAIKLISNGYGYTVANVSIVGDGVGATAEADVSNGRVTKINMLTYGSGYTTANIVIDGNGNGASARAILPPVTGHGKNIVNELYADSLALYTTISREKNKGFEVINDYRQLGLIKNIRKYNSNQIINKTVASACWVLTSTIDTTVFVNDLIIKKLIDNSRFVIIASTPSGVLVQSIDGGVPTSGDVFQAPTAETFTVSGVTAPDVDKYSGELLFIDNRLAFTASADQNISIKTVFKY